MADIRRAYADAWPQLRASLIVLAAIGGTVAFFAIAANAIGRNFGEFLKLNRAPTPEEAAAAIPLEYGLSSAEKNDVIFLGDSTCLRGIDPAIFEKACGLRGYNLGSLWALGIDGMIVTAEAYLSKHPPPKMVVLCLSPEVPSLTAVTDPFAREFVWTYGRPFGIVPRAARESHGIDRETVREGAAIVMRHGATLLQGSSNARDAVIEGLFVPATHRGLAAARAARRGYEPLPRQHDPTSRHEEHPDYRVPVLPEWREGVRELARLVAAKGSRLMIRLSPMRRDAQSQNFTDVVCWLRDLQKEYPQADVKTELLFYESPLCWDRRHLNSDGVKKFTNLIADDISAATRIDSLPSDKKIGPTSPKTDAPGTSMGTASAAQSPAGSGTARKRVAATIRPSGI